MKMTKMMITLFLTIVISVSACTRETSPDNYNLVFTSNRDNNNWDIYKNNFDGTNTVRLTDQPGIDANPSYSPDGKKIAFQSDRDSNLEIYIMDAICGSTAGT